MSSPKIEVVVKNTLLGEGPHWNAEKQELVYVDLPGKAVHRYVPATGKDYKLPLDGKVTFVIPVEGKSNEYIIGLDRNLSLLEWDGESSKPTSLKTITTVENNYPTNRFNDGKCDHQGRLWMGTMGNESSTPGVLEVEGIANLYRLDLDGKLTVVVDKIDISNGLAFSKDSSKFFYIDSCAFSIDVFDYDVKTGGVSNRRKLFDLKKEGITGLPDGMCADVDDNLWLAVFTGAKILKIDSKTGKILQTLDFSKRASKLTSCAFGGKNLDELYITSATLGLTKEQLAAQPDAGALFKVTGLGTRGQSAGINYKGKLNV